MRKIEQLTRELLAEYPVWKWDASEDYKEPVTNWSPLPIHEHVLFLKADFTAADGTEFEGYLVGLRSFYAFGLFVNDRTYVLNLNLKEELDEDVAEIYKSLGKEKVDFFPVEYKTNLAFEAEGQIAGILTIDHAG